MTPPPALETIAFWIAVVSIACAIVAGIAVIRQPPKMAIMAVVWPITALYAGPLGLAAYVALGRRSLGGHGAGGDPPGWSAALLGATHCGAGCAVGDVAGEWLVYLSGLVLFGSALVTKLVVASVLAFAAGIVFQYFAIAPMRGLGLADGLKAALAADTLSLVAYEVGMFAWMIVVQLWLLPGLEPTSWSFWLMMQVAMLLGLATTLPVNLRLIRRGIKEAM
jgi:hypothetical protein